MYKIVHVAENIDTDFRGFISFSIFVSENLIKISLSLIVTLVSPRVI
jgi:hypothetical protein